MSGFAALVIDAVDRLAAGLPAMGLGASAVLLATRLAGRRLHGAADRHRVHTWGVALAGALMLVLWIPAPWGGLGAWIEPASLPGGGGAGVDGSRAPLASIGGGPWLGAMRALVALGMAGAVLAAVRLAWGAAILGRAASSGEAAPEWARRLCAERAPGARCRLTDRTDRPLCFGLARGTILLPAGLAHGAEPAARSALEHELAHLALGHHRARAATALAGVLLFWNPLLRGLVARQREDAERLADDVAARRVGGLSYARGFLALAERRARPARLGPALAALEAEGELAPRLREVLGRAEPLATRARRRLGWALASGALCLGVLVSGLCGPATRADSRPAIGPGSTVFVRVGHSDAEELGAQLIQLVRAGHRVRSIEMTEREPGRHDALVECELGVVGAVEPLSKRFQRVFAGR